MIDFSEKASLDRPAFTSCQETGNFEAYKHRHSIIRGKFVLQKDYYVHKTQSQK